MKILDDIILALGKKSDEKCIKTFCDECPYDTFNICEKIETRVLKIHHKRKRRGGK